MLIGGGVLILCALLFVFVRTVGKERQRIRDDLDMARASVAQIIRLRDNINGMEAPGTPPNQSQFVANVNNLLSEFDLNASAFNEKQKTEKGSTTYIITLTLRAVELEAFIKYLHAVEPGRRVAASVVNCRINRAVSGKEVYDINLTLSMSVPQQK